jgi:hypothetical protein
LQDVEVQEQIERDVARTHPDMHFFCGAGTAAAQHRAQMRRALFVFAKLNPGLRYVQVGRRMLGSSRGSGSSRGRGAALPTRLRRALHTAAPATPLL